MAAAHVAFLGTHNWRAHEAMRSRSAAYGQEERASAEAGADVPHQLDVFGIARPPLNLQPALVWHGLRPGDDARIARAAGVGAVVCSGQGPNDVTIVKDCLRAGKAAFVESMERFQPSDLAEVAALTCREAGSCSPALMSGLYLRFDSALQEAAAVAIESLVGRPLLYQAHSSAADPAAAGRVAVPFLRHHRYAPVAPTLHQLGMEQVDVLRHLLKSEACEVYAVGTLPPGLPQGAAPLGAYQALTLTIKTSAGVPAVITLDSCGAGAPRQRITVVGDTNRVSFAGAVGAAELQEAGISHFLDVVTKGSKPQLAAADCLAAAAVMAAAEQSLRTGTPVAVSRDWAAFAAGPAGATATVTLAASAAAACKLSDAASALVLGSCQPVQGSRKVSGAFTPPERPAN